MAYSKPAEFFSSLMNSRSIQDITSKTKAERTYLKRKYTTIASLKNGFTTYRNYFKGISSVFSSPSISKPLSHNKANVPYELILQIILDELRLTKDEQAIFNQQRVSEIKSGKSNLRQVYDAQEYLDKASKLLDANSYKDNILGLCALTGRRAAEIGSTAQFKYIDKAVIEFTGQLKTKERPDVVPYLIPTLYDSKKIISTLNKVREVKSEFINEPELFHDTVSKDLSTRVKKHFQGLFEGFPKVKDLRAIYALISFSNFHKIKANRKVDRDVYFSLILGHNKDDITTCGSYVDFYLNT